jgi:Somatomedin B domain
MQVVRTLGRVLMRRSCTVLVVLILSAFAASAHAENTVLHFQGRGWGSWNGETVTQSAQWTSRTFNFSGNSRLDSYDTNVTVRNAIASYCSGANNCIVVCFSAGCSRVLKAIDDLRAAGNTLPGLFWVQAAGSAAGGTKLAEIATSGFTGFLAKLFGQQEAIDFDLTPAVARGTFGYTQDAIPPDAMYQVAGNQDICKGFWFFKICGNHFIDAGIADGLIGIDSASGASAAGRYWDGCSPAKYPGRIWEPSSPCGGEARDHFGLVGRTIALLAPQIQGVANDKMLVWGERLSDPDCDDAAGKCDNPASNPALDFSRAPDGTQVAADVSPKSSGTTGSTAGATCAGKCGKYSGASCWCDASCATRGDCCADYAQAKCDIVNSP